LQPPDTGLGRKRVYGVSRTQGTCLVAVNVVDPRLEQLTDMMGLGRGGKRGKKRDKETDGRDGRTPPPNKFTHN